MAKTVLQMTPEERKMYHPGLLLQQRTEEDKKHLARRYDQAWRIARQAASLLRIRYGASRVIVFGSLANEALFNAWSNINLAAWGISPEQFYAAVGDVTGLSPRFNINLVDLENYLPDIRQKIEEEGIEA